MRLMIICDALARGYGVEPVVSGCLAVLAPFLVALVVGPPVLHFVLHETLSESQNAPFMRLMG